MGQMRRTNCDDLWIFGAKNGGAKKQLTENKTFIALSAFFYLFEIRSDCKKKGKTVWVVHNLIHVFIGSGNILSMQTS